MPGLFTCLQSRRECRRFSVTHLSAKRIFFQESLEVKAFFRISAQQGNNYRESTRKEQICKLKMVGKSCKKQKQKQLFMNNGRS